MTIAVWSNKGKGSMLVSCHVIKPSSWEIDFLGMKTVSSKANFSYQIVFLGLSCENGNPTGVLKIPFFFSASFSPLCLQFPAVPFFVNKTLQIQDLAFIMKFLTIKEKSHGGMKTSTVIEPGKIFFSK